jgi:Kef-type K+ transport system membrane component KefB
MHSALELTLLLLGTAVFGVVAFRMLHLPPMLGYLVVGVRFTTIAPPDIHIHQIHLAFFLDFTAVSISIISVLTMANQKGAYM